MQALSFRRPPFHIFIKRLLALVLFTLCVILLHGCAPKPNSSQYQTMYAHLNKKNPPTSTFTLSDYFLVILVDARHLDYSDNLTFFRTVAKHPDDGCKQGDVGHAWIYLQGLIDDEPVYVEGGCSGESGLVQARYFDGIMNGIDYGYANPTAEERKCPRYEPNPAKYLWETQDDGFFQWGSGCHTPTYAAKVTITEEQFQRIWSYIDNFSYRNYSLINSQCSSFAAQVASLAGLEFDCEVGIAIQPEIEIRRHRLRFWTDPIYSLLTVSSPDVIERSLMEAVNDGRAESALDWYLHNRKEPWSSKITRWKKTITRFPKRLFRYLLIAS